MGARRTNPARTPEAAFVEFRRTRQPQPLAEVFDACAQELLLVAHHLATRGVSAEDLLQSTFLEAIAHAEKYEAGRALAPWLCGILINVARRQNREQRREFEAWRFDDVASEDPSELAHAREFAVALRESIESFPAPQREVLTLRLVHGLTPTQIAHALGHPVGSVKSWIHRGAEKLQRALPASFATALAAIVRADASLDALRARILEEACEPGLPISKTSVPHFAAALRARWLLATLVIALVSVVGATVWRGVHGERDVIVVGESPSSSPGAEASTRAPARSTLRSPTPAGASASPGEPRSEAAAGLTVRARFASDGSPASIAIEVEPRMGADTALRSFVVWTDADGLAQLPELAAGEWTLTPDRSDGGAIAVHAPSSVDVEIPPGASVSGVVRDVSGSAIVGARVWLSSADSLSDGQFVALSDASGEFAVRDVPAARAIAIVADGFEPTPLRAVSSFGAAKGEFVLAPAATSLRGVVRDDEGRPVSDARVMLGEPLDPRWSATHLPEHDLRAPLVTRTDAHGRFEFSSAFELDRARVFARAPGFALLAEPVQGRSELELHLARGRSWSGVLDSNEDARREIELSAQAVRPISSEPVRWPDWFEPRGRFFPGEFELRGLTFDSVVLSAREHGATLASRDQPADLAPRISWSPTSARPSGMRGIVRLASGAPLPRVRVQLFDSKGASRTAVVSERGEFEFDVVENVGESATFAVSGESGSFDASLEPWIRVDPSRAPLELVVRDEHAPRSKIVARPVDREGRALENLYAAREFDLMPIEAVQRPDGAFEIGPAPAGDYYLFSDGAYGPQIAHGPVTLDGAANVDLGELRAPAPARLTVRMDGPDASTGVTPLVALGLPAGRIGVTYFKLTQGVGTCLPTVPGRAQFVILSPTLGCVVRDVELLEGLAVEHAVSAPFGTPVTLRLDDDDPREQVRARIVWRRVDGSIAVETTVTSRRNGDDGMRASRWNLEPGRYRVEVLEWGTREGGADVEVSAGPETPDVLVKLR